MAIRICPECGGKCTTTRKDCPHCGYIFKEEKKCPECEEMIDASASICPVCGYYFLKTEKEESKEEISEKAEETSENVVTESATKPSLISIACPNCASIDCSLIGNDEYMCNICQSRFKYNDGKPTIINNYINNVNNSKIEIDKRAVSFKKTINEDEYKRSLFISLAMISETPGDIFDNKFDIIEENSEVYFGAFEVESTVICSVGYDRIEEYWDKEKKTDGNGNTYYVDVKKTRTVTDWSPFSGSGSGTFKNCVFEDGEYVENYFKIVEGALNEEDAPKIDFPDNYSKKACDKLKQLAEFECERSINIPGDRHKDASYQSKSKMIALFYFLGPTYKSSYTYAGQQYCDYAFAYGNGLPPRLKDYPKEDGNILEKAKTEIKTKAKISKICKILAGISLGIAFTLLFYRFPWIWPIPLGLIIVGAVIEIKSNKIYNESIGNSKKANTITKKNNLIKCLKDNNLDGLTKEEEKKFDSINDADSFSSVNKKKFSVINYVLGVLFLIVFGYSIYSTVLVINDWTTASLVDTKNIYIDVVSKNDESSNYKLNSYGYDNKLVIQIYSTKLAVSSLYFDCEVYRNNNKIGTISITCTSMNLEAGVKKNYDVSVSNNGSKLDNELQQYSLSAFSFKYLITGVYYKNGSYASGYASTYNLNNSNAKNDTNNTTSSSNITNLDQRKNDKIYFGTYPQTKVEATVENGLSSIIFDVSTWISYKYYIELEKTDFMYYKDVDIDNNGTLDYRGVYFTQYRPYNRYNFAMDSSADNSWQDENGYSIGQIYWFSYDPIEWNILTESNGKALILADLILDSQEYYLSLSNGQFEHNGGIGYANNYELSNIRKFLNDTFYNTAFNDLQRALIEKITVDNSESSTTYSSRSYVCNNTEDKIFLLSYFEAGNSSYGLGSTKESTTARVTKGSDYAKCQGLYVESSTGCSRWWLRSPSYGADYVAYYVDDYGNKHYDHNVFNTDDGVRPACWITLDNL